MSGKFITIEGIEGAGKSTALQFVKRFINKHNKTVMVTREPGGTAIGENIRALLLNPENTELSNDAELLLMFAARAQHIAEKIKPALEKGEWVLCDRFTDATYAYQGGGRGIDNAKISNLESFVQDKLRPDLTLLLDIDPESGLNRAARRGKLDRFENEKIRFFERVRKCYLDRAEQYPHQIKIIDGSETIKNVQLQIETVLSGILADNLV